MRANPFSPFIMEKMKKQKLTLLYNRYSSEAPASLSNGVKTLKKMCRCHFEKLGLMVEVREMEMLDIIVFDEFGINIESELHNGEQVYWLIFENDRPSRYFTNENLILDEMSREDIARSFLSRKRRRVEMKMALEYLNANMSLYV